MRFLQVIGFLWILCLSPFGFAIEETELLRFEQNGRLFTVYTLDGGFLVGVNDDRGEEVDAGRIDPGGAHLVINADTFTLESDLDQMAVTDANSDFLRGEASFIDKTSDDGSQTIGIQMSLDQRAKWRKTVRRHHEVYSRQRDWS